MSAPDFAAILAAALDLDQRDILAAEVDMMTAKVPAACQICGGTEIAHNDRHEWHEYLEARNRAWMNGVADAVEQFGFDRDAACGPADLLPGLDVLNEAYHAERALADELAEALRRTHTPEQGWEWCTSCAALARHAEARK